MSKSVQNSSLPRVWAGKSSEAVEESVVEALRWLDYEAAVPRNARVAIKPNLTYPFYKPGVTTSPALIEAVVKVLRQRTEAITIVESDGGSYAWPAQEAFAGHGINDICAKYGIRAVNLTEYARDYQETEILGRRVGVELSRLLTRETDVFITMPVPKVHVMTRVSLGFKNQWGCLPDVKRLRNHAEFPYKVLAINKILKPRFAIFDGSYFLNRCGPMEGDAIKMGLLIAADDVGAGTLACCQLMQIEPRSVAHLRLAIRAGMMPGDPSGFIANTGLEQFQGPAFYLKRSLMHWLTLGIFHSSFASRIVYDSGLSKPLHEILYAIRGRPRDFAPRWGKD